jgi:hypothetical protein
VIHHFDLAARQDVENRQPHRFARFTVQSSVLDVGSNQRLRENNPALSMCQGEFA